MAFNPFDIFRKRQRSLMAVLVIFCMFIFVLSSGTGGDIFMRANEWFGYGPTREYATMYGDEIKQPQVQEIGAERQIANMFMLRAVEFAHRKRLAAAAEVLNSTEIRDPRFKQTLLQFADMRGRDDLGIDPGMISFQIGQQIAQPLSSEIDIRRRAVKGDDEKQSAQLRALESVQEVMASDMQRIFRGEAGRSVYFDTVGNGETNPLTDPAQLLEFMLWLRKAEDMSVSLTTADLNALVMRETFRVLNAEDFGKVQQGIAQSPNFTGFSEAALNEALRHEFYVRIAQQALLGRGTPDGVASPTYATPWEFWKYFQDTRTFVDFGVLAFKSEDFIDQVKQTPTDKELEQFFDSNKRKEHDPAQEEPGFKRPRRIRVEFVGGELTDYYREKAPQVRVAAQALMQLSDALTVPAGGGALAPAAALAGSLAMTDADVAENFQRFRTNEENLWGDVATTFPDGLHAGSVWRPEVVAGMVGQAAGSFATGAPILSVPNDGLALAVRAEVRDRMRIAGPMLMATAPGALATLAPTAAALPNEFPFEAVKDQLLIDVHRELAASLFESDWLEFQKKVEELAKQADAKAAVSKYAQQFAEERGLVYGKAKDIHSQYTIDEDPNLQPLNTANQATHMGAPADVKFGREFFNAPDGDTFSPKWYPGMPRPEQLLAGDKVFLTWLTDDKKPEVPSFADVKQEVLRAWKLRKARDLAKKKAEELVKQLPELKGDRQRIKDLAAEVGATYLTLDRVAKLAQQEAGFSAGPRRYQRYEIPEATIEHPSPGIVEELLAIKDDPYGTSKLLTDEPKAHYYAATLVQRDEGGKNDFHTVYLQSGKSSSPFGDMTRNPLLPAHLLPERYMEARKVVLDQLKAEAKYSDSFEEDRKKKS